MDKYGRRIRFDKEKKKLVRGGIPLVISKQNRQVSINNIL